MDAMACYLERLQVRGTHFPSHYFIGHDIDCVPGRFVLDSRSRAAASVYRQSLNGSSGDLDPIW